ncbi:MAG: V-type ATP synthase subunit F [Spirochaetaceae bacterium]|jgi:V/A-type H+-transporting ATPase subunit F|nr:V-type ATP synthase subunit F [Spirochaetaceae bacterium]
MDYFFIGDPELVTAFRFVGIHGHAVSGKEDALAVFKGLTGDWGEAAGPVSSGEHCSCLVLIITEETADWLGETLTDWQLGGKYPLVVEIPGTMGHLAGRKTLVDSIREAIGIHV